ncbi:hypothetical protein BH10BAC4_BH10BAC4_16940 [soil metagenome]
MLKKPFLLFLALLLPALIFVFLKFAGKNEFTVPVFHEHGVALPGGCSPLIDSLRDTESLTLGGPYTLGLAVMNGLGTIREANVIVFPAAKLDVDKLSVAIDDEIGIAQVSFSRGEKLSSESLGIDQLKKCIFFVNEPSQSVLIDKEGRIRGYYDLTKRDEVDRLRVELKIILKRY